MLPAAVERRGRRTQRRGPPVVGRIPARSCASRTTGSRQYTARMFLRIYANCVSDEASSLALAIESALIHYEPSPAAAPRQSPSWMALMNTSRTIEQLEADPWAEPSSDAPDYVRRCFSLRRIPVGQLAARDLRVLIGQDIALSHLVPLALPLLKADALLEAEYYPGDLLAAAMRITSKFWEASPREHAELVAAAKQAEAKIGESDDPSLYRQITKDIAEFLSFGEIAR